MRMANDRVNESIKDSPSSPTRECFGNSGSDDVDEWSSCAGELEKDRDCDPVFRSKSPKKTVQSNNVKCEQVQSRSNLIQRHRLSGTPEESPASPATSSYPLTKPASSAEPTKAFPDALTEPGDVDKRVTFRTLRTGPNQGPTTNRDMAERPLSLSGVACESTPFSEPGATGFEGGAPVLLQQSGSTVQEGLPNTRPGNQSLLAAAHYKSKENTLGTNISRSVSFNDRFLTSTRKVSPGPPTVKFAGESGGRGTTDSPTIPASGDEPRRLQSTPERQTIASKHSPSSSSSDIDQCRGGGEGQQGKLTIKNLTSNLARHLSLRKNKTGQKRKEGGGGPPAAPSGDGQTTTTTNTNGLPSPEDAVVSYEGLLQLFVCPGCQIFMIPPLLQCKKGHLLCDKCRINFKSTCPICKQRVIDTTNYMMEQVCQLVRFPCRFSKYGCPEYHAPKQKTDHENYCIYRPVYCHFAGSGCECVLPLKEMNAHVSSCHFKNN